MIPEICSICSELEEKEDGIKVCTNPNVPVRIYCHCGRRMQPKAHYNKLLVKKWQWWFCPHCFTRW